MAVKLFAYRRGSSVLHRTPALVKLVLLMALCIATFSGGSSLQATQKTPLPAAGSLINAQSISLIIRVAICLFVSFIAFLLSGAHKESLKQVRFVVVIGLLVTVFDLLYFQFGTTAPSATASTGAINGDAQNSMIIMILPFFGINLLGLYDGLLYTVRFFITALAAQVVFETTSALEIQDAFESLQTIAAKIIPPLRKWNPAFVISLAINFIPEVFETWNKVNLAARARTKDSHARKNTIFILYQELLALFSCLLHFAEMKRQAILNRSGTGLVD